VPEERLITARQLRDIIAERIENSIQIRRISIGESDRYDEFSPDVSDAEITDFVFSNALFDSETVQQLFDPGLLGFEAKTAKATDEWLEEFKENVSKWASSNAWLGGDPPFWIFDRLFGLEESATWRPADGPVPSTISRTRSAILLAEEILKNQGRLTELDWRVFEKLVAELLERDGFSVILTQGSRDGGIDVIADKLDPTLGSIRTIWQAKCYSELRKVGLSSVRELSALLDRSQSSKAYLVTTSSLTGGAVKWIRQDRFRLDYREHDDIANWILGPMPTLR
jgi:hypothetical protein